MPELVSHHQRYQEVSIQLLQLLSTEILKGIVIPVFLIGIRPCPFLRIVHEDLRRLKLSCRDAGRCDVLKSFVLNAHIDDVLRVLRHGHLAEALDNQKHSEQQYRTPVLLQIFKYVSHSVSLFRVQLIQQAAECLHLLLSHPGDDAVQHVPEHDGTLLHYIQPFLRKCHKGGSPVLRVETALQDAVLLEAFQKP